MPQLTPVSAFYCTGEASPYETPQTENNWPALIDGDRYGTYLNYQWGPSISIGFDLGSPQLVNYIDIYSRYNGATVYGWYAENRDCVLVLGRNDTLSNWTQIERFDGPPPIELGNGRFAFRCSFATAQEYRYFKVCAVDALATSPSGWPLYPREIEAYSTIISAALDSGTEAGAGDVCYREIVAPRVGDHADTIRQMITQMEGDVTSLAQQVASLDARIADLNSQKDALLWLMEQTVADLEARCAAKFGVGAFIQNPTCGVTDLTSWDYLHGLFNLIAGDLSGYSFGENYTICPGVDLTGVVIPGQYWIHGASLGCLDGWKVHAISAVTLEGSDTRITLTSNTPYGAFTGAGAAFLATYTGWYRYNVNEWDGDSIILALIGAFNVAYDHINDDIGSSSGFHGITDMISKLTTARGILETTRAFYASAAPHYAPYASAGGA